jgi:hypothetical protein
MPCCSLCWVMRDLLAPCTEAVREGCICRAATALRRVLPRHAKVLESWLWSQ